MDPLLEDAKLGSPAACDRLTALFARDLRGFVDRNMGTLLKRQLSLADVCQDSMVQAIASLDVLNPDATLEDFKRLLFRHARWILIDRGRKGRRFAGESAASNSTRSSRATEGAGAMAQVPDGAASQGGPVTASDEVRWLHALIARLDDRFGRVIALRLDGRSFAEIAAEMKESEASVRKRYQRAVLALRRITESRRANASAPGAQHAARPRARA